MNFTLLYSSLHFSEDFLITKFVIISDPLLWWEYFQTPTKIMGILSDPLLWWEYFQTPTKIMGILSDPSKIMGILSDPYKISSQNFTPLKICSRSKNDRLITTHTVVVCQLIYW